MLVPYPTWPTTPSLIFQSYLHTRTNLSWVNFKPEQPGCWNSILYRIRYATKSGLYTPNRMQSLGTSKTNITAHFLNFPTVTHTQQSDQRFRSYDLWNLSVAAGNSSFLDRLAKQIHFGVWAFIPMETEEVQNTTNVGNFPSFPRRGIAPDFNIGRRYLKGQSW
jgi:hypothetical protein